MKKIIFGIFAHPDDEAFIVAGTLLQETRAGAELHLITLTDGDNGTNPDNLPNLGEARLREWHAAGHLLGATSMHHLGFEDGTLNNIAMLEAAEKIEAIVSEIVSNHEDNVDIEFITFDLNGLTGHIDHIVASRAASLVFYRFKAHDARYKRMRLACFSQDFHPSINIDWVFMEPGRPRAEINETIDARPLRDDIIAIIRTHHTQRGDGEAHIKSQGENLGLNYFSTQS